MAGESAFPDDDPPTPQSLLERARALDPAAWQRLVALYSPLVYRWCRRARLQPADADDLGQQVFACVARGLKTFRRDRPGDTFRGWLHTITLHRLCDYARSRQRNRNLQPGPCWEASVRAPSEDSSSSSGPVAADDLRLLCRRVLELVRPDFAESTWRAFWLVTVEGRAAAEAAAELGLSVNAVYLARGRVLHRLREEFADLIDGPFFR